MDGTNNFEKNSGPCKLFVVYSVDYHHHHHHVTMLLEDGSFLWSLYWTAEKGRFNHIVGLWLGLILLSLCTLV